jgi:hypothetical protein
MKDLVIKIWTWAVSGWASRRVVKPGGYFLERKYKKKKDKKEKKKGV